MHCNSPTLFAAAALCTVLTIGCSSQSTKSKHSATIPTPTPATPVQVPQPQKSNPVEEPNSQKTESPKPSGWITLFPEVRVNRDLKAVEFTGTIAVDHKVFLEVLACPKNTKEHESLVVTAAAPSHVHAALLLIGLVPGSPGFYDWRGATLQTTAPTGPSVEVTLIAPNLPQQPLSNFAVQSQTGQTLTDRLNGRAFVFAGSTFAANKEDPNGPQRYRADADGTLIGLSMFGGETVACPDPFNPDSGVAPPQWLSAPTLPPRGTAVTVQIRAISPTP